MGQKLDTNLISIWLKLADYTAGSNTDCSAILHEQHLDSDLICYNLYDKLDQ
jgi:hypothetical protein